jgi:hypothetical protein
MAFNFLNSNLVRKEYKYSFLQQVTVRFNFDKIERETVDSDFTLNLNKFFVDVFQSEIPQDVDLWTKPIVSKRNDGIYSFYFGLDEVAAVIGAKDYHSFVDNVIPQLFRLKKFLKDVYRRNEITSITIAKVNTWPFKLTKETSLVNPKDVLKLVLKEELYNQEKGEWKTDEQKLIPLKTLTWTDNKRLASAKGRFYPQDEKGEFACELDTEASVCDKIKLDDIEYVATSLNDDLYQLYHWCVTNQVIDIMNGTQK